MKGLIYSHAGLNKKPSVSTPAGGHMADDHQDSLHDGGNVGGSEKAKCMKILLSPCDPLQYMVGGIAADMDDLDSKSQCGQVECRTTC